MRLSLLFMAVTAALAGCSESQSPPEAKAVAEQSKAPDYRIALVAEPISNTAVRFTVSTTDVPLPVEVMADLTLAGLKDDDVWIGAQKKVFLDKPVTSFVVESSASKPLPSGEYDAEVSFYKRWGAEANPEARDVPNLSAKQLVTIGGSGESAEHAKRRVALQRWVMGNVGSNDPWNEARMVAKLGRYERSQADLSHLHDAYYFPDADMTLIVNRLRGEITIWRQGRQSI